MRPRWWIGGLLFVTTFVPATAMAVASAELYRTQAYVYGRFEARVQYAPGDGVVSSFFLWKNGSTSTTLWNELDYEKLNADCHMQTNAWTGLGGVQHTAVNAMPGNICTGYHTYSFEWTPTYIAWFVDGSEIRRETGAIAADYATNASAGLTIHFNTWVGNASFGGTLNPSSLPVHEYISWVQYSSYVNGAFQLQWREEFDGTGVPSGWAEGDWASPYSLSTHKPANVNYVNGIAVLSLTADGATGYTGTPPVDSAAATGGASAGTGGAGTGGAGKGGAASGGAGTGGAGVGGAGKGGAASGGAATGGVANRGGSSNSGGASVTSGGTATNSGGNTAIGGTSTSNPANVGGRSASGGAVSASGGVGGSSNGGATAPASGGALASSSGGATAMSGGATSVTTSTTTPNAGASTTTPATPAESGGCSCRTVERRHAGTGLFGLGLLGLTLLGRRRRANRT